MEGQRNWWADTPRRSGAAHTWQRPTAPDGVVRCTRDCALLGRDALIAQAGLLELERLGRETELQVRRAVEVGPDVRHILSEIPERERHGRDSTAAAVGR